MPRPPWWLVFGVVLALAVHLTTASPPQYTQVALGPPGYLPTVGPRDPATGKPAGEPSNPLEIPPPPVTLRTSEQPAVSRDPLEIPPPTMPRVNGDRPDPRPPVGSRPALPLPQPPAAPPLPLPAPPLPSPLVEQPPLPVPCECCPDVCVPEPHRRRFCVADNPPMMGDFLGPRYFTPIAVTRNGVPGVGFNSLPVVTRGPYKIAENESPRPLNRVFVNYNYFRSDNPFPGQSPVVGRTDVHRETFGFERTLLDGNASVGVRIPFIQYDHRGRTFEFAPGVTQALAENLSGSEIGDVSVVFKYALVRDCATGNVVSTGMVVTAPTGPTIRALDPSAPAFTRIDSTIFQPYVGGILNCGDFFVQGFSAVAVPSSADDVSFLFNDVGLGFWAYRANCCCSPRRLMGVVPMVEAHVNTPLNNRGSISYVQDAAGTFISQLPPGPIFASDSVVLTGGVSLLLGDAAFFSTGVATPVTGPRPYDLQALVQLNVRY